MDRKEIEYVLTIAQEKTLSKAADRLCVSQPALSRFLQKLEGEIGLPLFERRKRQLIPTFAGEMYLNTARKVLQLQQSLELELQQLQEVTFSKLSIGITPGRGHTVLPRILPEFQKNFPDSKLDIHEDNVENLERSLMDGSIDVAFFTLANKAMLSQAHFSYERISPEEIVLCTPKHGRYDLLGKDVPGRSYPWIDLTQLEKESFILLKKTMRLGQLASDILERNGLYPKIVEMSTIDTALCLVAQEYGVAFASSFRIEEHETSGRINVFSFGEQPEVWDFVAAYRNDYKLPQSARFLISLLTTLY